MVRRKALKVFPADTNGNFRTREHLKCTNNLIVSNTKKMLGRKFQHEFKMIFLPCLAFCYKNFDEKKPGSR